MKWVFPVLLFFSCPSWATVVLSTHTAVSGSAPTTSAINTTGATLLVVGQSYNGGYTPPTDSLGNTWSGLPNQAAIGGMSIWYSSNPIVGASQTFTGAGASFGMCVMAFSGVLSANPLDQQNGSTTAQPGSITPTQANELIVSYIGGGTDAGPYTIDSGMTITDQLPFVGAVQYSQGCAYSVQTVATAINPTWTGWGNSATEIASFKATPVVVAVPPPNLFQINGAKLTIQGGQVAIR